MVTNDEIISLGFTKVDAWSTDITDAYRYTVIRHDKPRNTINLYRLDKLIDTDYLEIKSTLQRETDFNMALTSFNGEASTVEDLFEILELMRERNRTV